MASTGLQYGQFDPELLSMWSLGCSPGVVLVSFDFSGFLPSPKNMIVDGLVILSAPRCESVCAWCLWCTGVPSMTLTRINQLQKWMNEWMNIHVGSYPATFCLFKSDDAGICTLTSNVDMQRSASTVQTNRFGHLVFKTFESCWVE